MPDQRGFAGSDLPQDVDDYRTERLVDDIFALADALAIEQFALVGHDWGGAIAWAAALRCDPRLTSPRNRQRPAPGRLPEKPDRRAPSSAPPRNISPRSARPGFDKMVEAKGFDWFFDTTFARHVDLSKITEAENAAIYRRLVAAGRVQRDAQLVPRIAR